MNVEQRRRRRNPAVFTLGILFFGWIAFAVNQFWDSDSARDLAMLLWLISPFVLALVLRLFAAEAWSDAGLKPNFRGNGFWYLFSLCIYPLAIAVVLAIGRAAGSVSVSGFSFFGIGMFLQTAIMAFVSNFFKNFFEEFAWRGYLTPKFNQLGWCGLVNHIVTGLIWGAWHIPYYLGILSSRRIMGYTSSDIKLFIPMVILGLVAASIVYGELRFRTRSLWPAVLAHTSANALILTLLFGNYIDISPSLHFLFTPSFEGILMIVLFAAMGILLYLRGARQMA